MTDTEKCLLAALGSLYAGGVLAMWEILRASSPRDRREPGPVMLLAISLAWPILFGMWAVEVRKERQR